MNGKTQKIASTEAIAIRVQNAMQDLAHDSAHRIDRFVLGFYFWPEMKTIFILVTLWNSISDEFTKPCDDSQRYYRCWNRRYIVT
jgi:hypothetical protein